MHTCIHNSTLTCIHAYISEYSRVVVTMGFSESLHSNAESRDLKYCRICHACLSVFRMLAYTSEHHRNLNKWRSFCHPCVHVCTSGSLAWNNSVFVSSICWGMPSCVQAESMTWNSWIRAWWMPSCVQSRKHDMKHRRVCRVFIWLCPNRLMAPVLSHIPLCWFVYVYVSAHTYINIYMHT